MLILRLPGTFHIHREGPKGQKNISANIDARKVKFGQNIYYKLGNGQKITIF